MIRFRISDESSTTKTRKGAPIEWDSSMIVSIHEIVAQGVGGQISVAREIHFLENAAAIGTDRLDREAHLVGNIGYGFASSELHENLKFAVRKLAVRRRRRIARCGKRQRFGERRADIFPARRNRAYRLEQVAGFTRLGKKSARAGSQQIDCVCSSGCMLTM